MLTALVREVSRSLGDCDLQHLARTPIDVDKAAAQHTLYCERLAAMGATILALPARDDLPDSVFVEDAAIVVNEIAIMTRMRSPIRQNETASVAEALARFRPLHWIEPPATIEGGDVLRTGRNVFVGLSKRTNAAGVRELARLLEPLGYLVTPVRLDGCLHLKTACCAIGDGRLLANRAWLDAAPLRGFEIVDVPAREPFAANVLSAGGTVLVASCFPATQELLDKAGERVISVDITELMKAEAGLTCMSILLVTSTL